MTDLETISGQAIKVIEEAISDLGKINSKNIRVFENSLDRWRQRTADHLKTHVSEQESKRFIDNKFSDYQIVDGEYYTERDLIVDMGEHYIDQLNVLKNEISKYPETILSLNLSKPKLIGKLTEFKTAFSIYGSIKLIGEGGNGFVFSALGEDGSNVAVKVLDPKRATTEKKKRFKNEFRFSSRNNHPNIITVLDHGLTIDGSPFYVMPLYECSLRKQIGTLNPERIISVFEQILDGVEAAHKLNVIHRDLKPENILIDSSGKVVVADFGIAEFEEDDLYTAVETKDGARMANVNYAAPEQRHKGKVVDKRCDIYALGLILNELFTSSLAFGVDYKKIAAVSKTHSYLDSIVEKMLKQDPSARYSSVEEIKVDMLAFNRDQINFQKLSNLRQEVISETEIDDPILKEPMKIISVNWADGLLAISLNKNVSPDWIWAFRNMGSHTAVMGKGPETFSFSGKVASVASRHDDAQRIIDYFKSWLPQVHNKYEDKLQTDNEMKLRKRHEELKARLKKAELEESINKTLKF